jgi:hypothetical protein
VEAATWQGRLVSFDVVGPWGAEEEASSDVTVSGLILLGAPLLLALHNLRSGRGDIGGAVRLAAFTTICGFISLVNLAHHPVVGSPGLVGLALTAGASAWVLYMAIEPYVRRHWPQVLIGWSRALAGRFRDPVVCGHILVGMAVGFAAGSTLIAVHWLSGVPFTTDARGLYANLIGGWAADVGETPLTALVVCFIFVLLRVVLRRTWLAAVAVFALVGSVFLPGYYAVWPSMYVPVIVAARLALEMTAGMRFGLLAFAANMILLRTLTGRYPITPDFSSWYASQGLLAIGFLLVIAVWCFRHALGGRRLLKADLLDA